MNDGASAVVPRGEENATFSAMMFDVLERAHHKGDTSETDTEAT